MVFAYCFLCCYCGYTAQSSLSKIRLKRSGEAFRTPKTALTILELTITQISPCITQFKKAVDLQLSLFSSLAVVHYFED
jgi:hypothetical protein